MYFYRSSQKKEREGYGRKEQKSKVNIIIIYKTVVKSFKTILLILLRHISIICIGKINIHGIYEKRKPRIICTPQFSRSNFTKTDFITPAFTNGWTHTRFTGEDLCAKNVCTFRRVKRMETITGKLS